MSIIIYFYYLVIYYTDMKPTILFILGTARQGRVSGRIAQGVFAHAQKHPDLQPVFLDVASYAHAVTGSLDSVLSAQARRVVQDAHGVVIISPEYNHGYPGELKLFLDILEDELHGKPVGFCGVSSGALGGARMIEQLKQVISAFQAIPINKAVYFAHAEQLIDAQGSFIDQAWKSRIDGMLDEVRSFIRI